MEWLGELCLEFLYGENIGRLGMGGRSFGSVSYVDCGFLCKMRIFDESKSVWTGRDLKIKIGFLLEFKE